MAFDWENYKKEILDLYLKDGHTLERIRQKLMDKYPEFNPSISSYRTKLRQWKALKQQQRQKRDDAALVAQTPSTPETPLVGVPAPSPNHSGQIPFESPIVPDLSSSTTPRSLQGTTDMVPSSSSPTKQYASPMTSTPTSLGPMWQNPMAFMMEPTGSTASTNANLSWSSIDVRIDPFLFDSLDSGLGFADFGAHDSQSSSNDTQVYADLIGQDANNGGLALTPAFEPLGNGQWSSDPSNDMLDFSVHKKTCNCPCPNHGVGLSVSTSNDGQTW